MFLKLTVNDLLLKEVGVLEHKTVEKTQPIRCTNDHTPTFLDIFFSCCYQLTFYSVGNPR